MNLHAAELHQYYPIWRSVFPIAKLGNRLIAEIERLPNGQYLVMLDNQETVVLNPQDRVELVAVRKET